MIGYSFMYAVSAKTSLTVLGELLRTSEAPLQSIIETRDGFVAAISVPSQPKSGSIYIYDRLCASMFALSVDGRENDFSDVEIGCMLPDLAKHLNAPSKNQPVATNRRKPVQVAPPRPQQRRHNRSRRRTNTVNVGTQPVAVAVAA